MKKTFKTPAIEVVKINTSDIIATSDIGVGGTGTLDARRGDFWEEDEE